MAGADGRSPDDRLLLDVGLSGERISAVAWSRRNEAVAIGPGGRDLAWAPSAAPSAADAHGTSDTPGTSGVVRLADGVETASGPASGLAVTWAGDRPLALAHQDAEVVVTDVDSSEQVGTLAVDPGVTRLASVGLDGRPRVWECTGPHGG